ncbi:hypothetical protein E2C01_070426 [Portunus trituberculatus]|uniref:Uncharacterized protein n=1 Tax=Portunus trituberculatus TaxID=210409 RepID=A0A5B7I1J1_PORTR|nr:hypothetical protein [Portunus trituberculatus]
MRRGAQVAVRGIHHHRQQHHAVVVPVVAAFAGLQRPRVELTHEARRRTPPRRASHKGGGRRGGDAGGGDGCGRGGRGGGGGGDCGGGGSGDGQAGRVSLCQQVVETAVSQGGGVWQGVARRHQPVSGEASVGPGARHGQLHDGLVQGQEGGAGRRQQGSEGHVGAGRGGLRGAGPPRYLALCGWAAALRHSARRDAATLCLLWRHGVGGRCARRGGDWKTAGGAAAACADRRAAPRRQPPARHRHS